MPIPPVTKEPIIHVDATPDAEYPLRILRAYRSNCDVAWDGYCYPSDSPTRQLLDAMNEHCRQRAEVLDKAIQLLEDAGQPQTE